MLQKLPMLAIQKHTADIVNKIQPIKFIWSLVIIKYIDFLSNYSIIDFSLKLGIKYFYLKGIGYNNQNPMINYSDILSHFNLAVLK